MEPEKGNPPKANSKVRAHQRCASSSVPTQRAQTLPCAPHRDDAQATKPLPKKPPWHLRSLRLALRLHGRTDAKRQARLRQRHLQGPDVVADAREVVDEQRRALPARQRLGVAATNRQSRADRLET